MQDIGDLASALRQGAQHLAQMAAKLDSPWSPQAGGLRQLHNMHARCLITSYASKFAQLSEAVLDSVERKHYLVYALAGRSLIEFTATLRHYITTRYRPLLEKGSLDLEEMKELLEIDDRHLRGGRFDWDSFFFKRYSKLKDDAVKQLASKKAKQKHIVDGIIREQVNVLTCIEKWAEEIPEVLIAYSLFCDLVHPNIGSSFLVASTQNQDLYFDQSKAKHVGADIFQQSFPILVSVTFKPFGENLALLIGTIWHHDELQ